LRRPPADEADRVPPGQYVTQDFPVLSAGPTPHTPLPEWTFSIRQGRDILKSWSWAEFQALPTETVTVDIHCVTRRQKLGTVWRGVPVRTLLDQVEQDAPLRAGVLRRWLHDKPARRGRERAPAGD
jgi:DMSO/TMAO reductase YedYZ molybdopterin-dependent catalytic subunit